ncbi:MCE family protein [Mycobacterium palustre]|uniref:Mammalian cell entry protein n=1 Tax=Mycobacterium palustre TaxID=153971 RepID=A0A1X1ZGH6_9MYCO|nr:MlaD family protein [Mycobacterium palustre]MCV7100421.1 MCE family protein [Mycobacterium palustre]ORW22429.1 mammalian cell entry protein [Mycobacterium palustre]
MYMPRRIKVQLAVFTGISVAVASALVFGYANLPAYWFGVGRYSVTLKLRDSAGLYHNSVVTYRGADIGRVSDVRLTPAGVEAELSLESGVHIPDDLRAEVHSVTALGEQYVALLPRRDDAPPLKNGDVIPESETSIPADINTLLDTTNRGLQVIPKDNLTTVLDESYTAVGGLGPELARIVDGSTKLAIDARANLDPLVTLIQQSKPLLDSQIDSSDSIGAWAKHLAAITGGLAEHDSAVAGVLKNLGPAVDRANALFDRLKPTLPTLLANLVSVGQVAVTYQPALEQLLVVLPQNVAELQATAIPNLNTKQDYRGLNLDLALNINLPPVCATGFLPPQQRRSAALVDAPDRPAGDIYCRIPQDSPLNARGARNYPCLSVPGKRAPTVKMCESDEQYVPLNDGFNWKGDPNATLSGQPVPQPRNGTPPQAPPTASAPPTAPSEAIPVAPYDPATGRYVAPDGSIHTQTDLANGGGPKSWQAMLVPPGG